MSMGTQDEYVLMDLYANLSGDTFESVERSRVSKTFICRETPLECSRACRVSVDTNLSGDPPFESVERSRM